VDWAWRPAAVRVGSQFVRDALGASHMDVAAQDSCLEDEGREKQNEPNVHAAAAPHVIAQGF
jgi:hypothetical protein